MLEQCDRIWINVNLITANSAVAAPYGCLNDQVLGVANGKIQLISAMSDIDYRGYQGEVIDAEGCWMSPGLIDCHTHLIYAGSRAAEFEQRLQGVSYQAIAEQGGGILSTVNLTRKAPIEQLIASSEPRLRALMREGVTTVEIKSGYGLDTESELKMLRAARILAKRYPIRIKTSFLGAHALPMEYLDDPDGYIEMVCQQMIPAAVEAGLVDAVDLFCETIGFNTKQCEQVFKTAKEYGLPIRAHTEQLSNQQGAELAARYNAICVDHLEWLDERGVKAMAGAGTVATLLPVAFYFLQDDHLPPIDLLRRHQVAMAVATDLNPGSAPLASLRLAMNMACTLFRLTPEEAFLGVTANGAKALGLGDSIGRLDVGMVADLVLWDIDQPADLAYQMGTHSVRQRIVAGEVCNVC